MIIFCITEYYLAEKYFLLSEYGVFWSAVVSTSLIELPFIIMYTS